MAGVARLILRLIFPKMMHYSSVSRIERGHSERSGKVDVRPRLCNIVQVYTGLFIITTPLMNLVPVLSVGSRRD